MRKSDVTFHTYLPYGGPPMVPAVNVKVSVFRLEDHISTIAQENGTPGFTQEWWDRKVTDDMLDTYFGFACENGWERLQSDAEEIFGLGVKVYSAGRSGGWAYIEGIPDFESWDAIMLGKWARFAKWARIEADDVPYQIVNMLCINFYEQSMEDDAESIAQLATFAV